MTATAKAITISCTRSKTETPVEVLPDDTASAVLERAGFDPAKYMLMEPGDGQDYGPTALIYDDISDGGKLHCVPQSTVGGV